MIKVLFLLFALTIFWSSEGRADVGICETFLQRIPLHEQETDFTCGPACARSLFEFIKGERISERHLAKILRTYEFGYTPPEHLENLWSQLGLRAKRATHQSIDDLRQSFKRGESLIVLITLDEIPHYAVVRKISASHVQLMDPWVARKGIFSTMPIKEFESLWTFTLEGRREHRSVIKVWRTGDDSE